MTKYNCKVCGLRMEDPPWGDDGKSPNYEICPCCGVEFGYQDYTVESTANFRRRWIDSGAEWNEIKEKPDNWNLADQLRNLE